MGESQGEGEPEILNKFKIPNFNDQIFILPLILSFPLPLILSFPLPLILSFPLPLILSFPLPLILSLSKNDQNNIYLSF